MAEQKSDDKMVVENEASKSKDDKDDKDAGKSKKDGKDDKDAGKSKKGAKAGDAKDIIGEVELSAADKELKESLELMVERVSDVSPQIQLNALEMLRDKIRTSTSSMTAVPKPLKFLSPLYPKLKTNFEAMAAGENRQRLSDILSVLATAIVDIPPGTSLGYKLTGNQSEGIGLWGHEYVRNLAGEIGTEFTRRSEAEPAEDTAELMKLVNAIVPFHISHNAEAEAVDLLIEVRSLELLLSTPIEADAISRINQYLLRESLYIESPADQATVRKVAFKLYMQHECWFAAARVALSASTAVSDSEETSDCAKLLSTVFEACKDVNIKKQLAFLIGRHGLLSYELGDDEEPDDQLRGDLQDILGNSQLSDQFRQLGRDLDVMEGKSPEDVYKSHLGDTGALSGDGAKVESAKQNQAATYVNAFVNLGFGKDKLMATREAGKPTWVERNKEAGKLSVAASVGMINQWDTLEGFNNVDIFLYSDDINVKAGAVLGLGVCTSSVYVPDRDPTLEMIRDYLEETAGRSKKDIELLRSCSIMSLGLAYAGTQHEEVTEELMTFVEDQSDNRSMDLAGLAAMCVGLINVGTNNGDIAQPLIMRVLESSDAELEQTSAKFLCLGIGLLHLGGGELSEVSRMCLDTDETPDKIKKYAVLTLDACAYLGSGNVLKVQSFLHECGEHLEKDADFQMVAVLGIAMVTMGEDIGSEMAHRLMEHLQQYCEKPIRRCVPLGLAMLHLSDPEFSVIDKLSKLTHDDDEVTAQNAILAMGLAGAGSNNSRVAGMLRQLSDFYKKDANHLYMVRIAQGLLHMGKGLVTLNPFHSDNELLRKAGIGSLLCIFHAAFNPTATLLGKFHYFLYFVAPAAQPRMLITVNENLEPCSKTVRVGERVDTVGQPGHPRTITGFQTHDTPVLLRVHERAVLTADDIDVSASVLEGVIICTPKKPKASSSTATVGEMKTDEPAAAAAVAATCASGAADAASATTGV